MGSEWLTKMSIYGRVGKLAKSASSKEVSSCGFKSRLCYHFNGLLMQLAVIQASEVWSL